MDGLKFRSIHYVLILAIAAIVLPQTGCIGLASQIMYVLKGHKIKAEYNGLEEKKVAIVVISESNAYGPDNSALYLMKTLRIRLMKEIPKATFIHPDQINDWIDKHYDDIDFVALGRDLKVDKVIGIDLAAYSLHEGTTLYKGRADYEFSVYDIENGGESVFSKGPTEFQFPVNHGQPTTSISERQFEKIFVVELSSDIAKYFYDYDFTNTVARDSAHLGG